MFAKQIETVDQLPLADRDRKCTDVCCTICGLVFFAIMLLLSLAMYSTANYHKTNFPTDADYRSCSHDLPGYPYVYFTHPSGDDVLNNRVCVASCPHANDTYLLCSPTKHLGCRLGPHVTIYETHTDINRLGGFCLPTDAKLREKLLQQVNLTDKWKFLNFFDLVKLSLLFGVFVGIIHMCIVQCLPKLVVWLDPVFASVMFLVLAFVIFVDSPNAWSQYPGLRVFVGLLFLLLAITVLVMTFIYRKHLQLCGVLIKYATRFLADSFCVYMYLPAFLLATVLLLLLFMWQYVAFSTANEPYRRNDDIYWKASSNTFLQVLNVVELIWGLQFLRDSFNFIVSGNAVEWYFSHRPTHCEAPLKRLAKRHFGSVVGGSLLNSFLMIPDLLFDTIRCERKGFMGRYAGCCDSLCCCCDNLFELVRSDVYAYINLTGIPYCNAARNCELLCSRTTLFSGSHSCLQMYRAASNWVNMAIVILICYLLMKGRTGDISLVALLLIAVFSWCLSMYFIGIHTDAAEGLQISFLLEHSLEHDSYRTMIRCPPGLRNEIEMVDMQLHSPPTAGTPPLC